MEDRVLTDGTSPLKASDGSALVATSYYVYSKGQLSLQDQGAEEPFEFNEDGVAQRADYQVIGEI